MAVTRMPTPRRSVKQRKAKSAKRTFFRRARTSGGTTKAGTITSVGPTNYGFPDRLQTKLQYCDVVQLQASAGSPGIHQFRLGSLFDPDFTGVGHQPQWFDTFATVYQKYRVLRSKITVSFIPNNISDIEANDKGPYVVGITTNQTATFGSSSYPALLEDANSVHDIIVDKQGGNNMKTLSATYVPKRDQGLDAYTENLDATMSANPSRDYFATIWALDMTELASQDVVAKVCIEFDAEFFLPKINVVS